MNQRLKLGTLAVSVISVCMVIWVNTGSHSEVGYMGCGGGSMPKVNTPSNPGIYNGPCLGVPNVGTVHGRYGGGATLIANSAFGVFAAASIVALVFEFRDRQPTPSPQPAPAPGSAAVKKPKPKQKTATKKSTKKLKVS